MFKLHQGGFAWVLDVIPEELVGWVAEIWNLESLELRRASVW